MSVHFGLKPYTKEELSKTNIFFSNQISITSKTGCGSSTILKELKKILGSYPYRFVSGGSIMRSFAASFRMSIEEFAEHCRMHPDQGWDEKCDQRIREFSNQNWVITEGRLPHVMMQFAFKTLLVCGIDIRVKRRMKDEYESYDQVYTKMSKRDKDDDQRYQIIYPGCLWKEKDYDFVISTEDNSPTQICEKILSAHKKWLENKKKSGIVIDSVSLYSS